MKILQIQGKKAKQIKKKKHLMWNRRLAGFYQGVK